MLENYRQHENGVVEQIKRKPFDYSSSYIHAYDKLDGEKMSELRFNNIVNSIGYLPHSILDYGYGNGAFLRYALERDVKCYGFDITGEPLPEGCEPFFAEIKYVECITFFDSLEHTNDIKETIGTLPKHKYVIVSVPAFREDTFYNDKWFAEWKHRKENEHLHFFSSSSLLKFMSQQGYVNISLNHCEDAIRKPADDFPNIMTGIFKKL